MNNKTNMEATGFIVAVLTVFITVVSVIAFFKAPNTGKNKVIEVFKGNLYFTEQACKQYKVKNCEIDNVYWIKNKNVFIIFNKINKKLSTQLFYSKKEIAKSVTEKKFEFTVKKDTCKPVDWTKYENLINDMTKTFNLPSEKIKIFFDNSLCLLLRYI